MSPPSTVPPELSFQPAAVLLPEHDAASGSTWKDVGATRPTRGAELFNDALASALLSRTTFSQKAWRLFGVSDLRVGDFIKSGGSYFQPDDTGNGKDDTRMIFSSVAALDWWDDGDAEVEIRIGPCTSKDAMFDGIAGFPNVEPIRVANLDEPLPIITSVSPSSVHTSGTTSFQAA